MRLRILELPSEIDKDRVTTPFAIVLDDVTEPLNAELTQRIKEQLCAKGLLVFPDRIELDSDSR